MHAAQTSEPQLQSDTASLNALRAQTATLAAMSREEDLGTGDITSALITDDAPQTYQLVSREAGVLAGCAIADIVLAEYDEKIKLEWCNGISDGVRFEPNQSLATLKGPPRSILSAERVLLNFLQRLCGIATCTAKFVDTVAGTGARIFDTRKTTPGWRHLEKYGVRCGGGHNHRIGLYDAVLIKDNHLAGIPTDRLANHVFELLNNLQNPSRTDATELSPPHPTFVEVEADSLDQVTELLKVVGIDVILLDNFSTDDLRRAVALRDDQNLRGKVSLEASGGITLDTARNIAETGVDRISIGAITHSATAIDLSLDDNSET